MSYLINFSNRTITNELLDMIDSAADALAALDLSGCENLEDDDLAVLEKMDHLQSLKIENCPKITDEGLRHVSRLFNLQEIQLYGCNQITDTGYEYLANLYQLKILGFACGPQTTPEGFNRITQAIERSKRLAGFLLRENGTDDRLVSAAYDGNFSEVY